MLFNGNSFIRFYPSLSHQTPTRITSVIWYSFTFSSTDATFKSTRVASNNTNSIRVRPQRLMVPAVFVSTSPNSKWQLLVLLTTDWELH